ncbi:MAG: NAD-dependent succinate-semialdehyde dehydrogenase [Betaproteobacteria bacterium]|nr:MAG: NAD-dependent succinate-semialdehyde dehydrogenase [Betaproteobacteria bacterium]
MKAEAGIADRAQRTGLFIDGRWREASPSVGIDVVDPATEEVVGRIPSASADDVQLAIDAARAAFPAWRATLPWDRATVLRRAADLIRARSEDLARVLTQEQGKPLAESRREAGMAADHFEWASEEGKRIYGTAIDARPAGTRCVVRHEPVGVVGALTPWNFPALQFAAKVSYALAAGCAVVAKPSEEVPGICIGLACALEDAGLPPGVLNLVFGHPPEISAELFASPHVRAVSFTGSTAVGKQLMAMAAPGLKRLTMELGGHAPLIVLGDVDPDDAATKAAMIKFRNAGQACVSPSRFYVHESIAARFTERLVECARALKLGSGLDEVTTMGPLANARRRAAAEDLVEDAKSHGARVRTGGARPAGLTRGFFFEPTVLDQVPESCRIMNVEPFAPIAPVAAFRDLDAAIAAANRLPYGLAAYAFTNSARDAARLADELEAGMVAINNFALATAETPFGGVKESGFGREGGPSAIHEYLTPKLVKTQL